MTNAKVLIVEDEILLAREIGIHLEDFGYNVVGMFTTAEEAISELHALVPDIILMDIMLPGEIDGIEAAQKIQQNHGIPVVYLTAYDDKEILDRAKITEPFGYILKPYSPRELNANIAMALYKSDLDKQLYKAACSTEVFSSISDALIGLDKEANIKLLNSSAEALLVRSKDSVMNCHWDKVLRGNDTADQLRMQQLIAGKAEEFVYDETLDIELLLDDDSVLSVELRLCPVKKINSQLTSVLLLRDVTRRKEAERELAKYHESLEEKVEERTLELSRISQDLDTYNYSVSHDLRAPLRAIDGFSLALQEDYADMLDDQANDYLRRVRCASKRMGELIDDLLMLSRISMDEMVFEEVDLSHLARVVIKCAKEIIPDCVLQYKIADNLKVKGDARLLRIMLENLIDNALKFTSGVDSPCIEIGEIFTDGKHLYFIRDNGIGFNMHYSEKMFHVFQRLHASEEFTGSGVGLAIVQRIIMKHHGEIWAEGEAGMGASFYFTLDENVSERKKSAFLQQVL